MLQPPVLRRTRSALDFHERSIPLRTRMAPGLLRGFGKGKKPSRAEVDEKREKSKEIDKKLKLDKKRRDKEIRVLLLGSCLPATKLTRG
jgi:hypothetical protein